MYASTHTKERSSAGSPQQMTLRAVVSNGALPCTTVRERTETCTNNVRCIRLDWRSVAYVGKVGRKQAKLPTNAMAMRMEC